MEKDLINNGIVPISIEEQAIEEIKYIPVEISKLDVHDGDTILLTFNMDDCDLETIKNIYKMWEQIIPPTINIITVIKPIVESIQIIHNKEEKPF